MSMLSSFLLCSQCVSIITSESIRCIYIYIHLLDLFDTFKLKPSCDTCSFHVIDIFNVIIYIYNMFWNMLWYNPSAWWVSPMTFVSTFQPALHPGAAAFLAPFGDSWDHRGLFIFHWNTLCFLNVFMANDPCIDYW